MFNKSTTRTQGQGVKFMRTPRTSNPIGTVRFGFRSVGQSYQWSLLKSWGSEFVPPLGLEPQFVFYFHFKHVPLGTHRSGRGSGQICGGPSIDRRARMMPAPVRCCCAPWRETIRMVSGAADPNRFDGKSNQLAERISPRFCHSKMFDRWMISKIRLI